MTMNRYLIRAVKYFLWLTVLFVVIFMLLNMTGTANAEAGQGFKALLNSSRGITMLVVIVVLSALYPRFGFVSRIVNADLHRNREAIVRAFSDSGFTLASEDGEHMSFKASMPGKKAMMLWEDTIVVTAVADGRVNIEGLRKEAVKAEFRLNSFVRNEE